MTVQPIKPAALNNIDNGLYFGKKNTYTDNQNIFITGIINSQFNNIKWELNKI